MVFARLVLYGIAIGIEEILCSPAISLTEIIFAYAIFCHLFRVDLEKIALCHKDDVVFLDGGLEEVANIDQMGPARASRCTRL
jgi:hypothetical protein